MKLKWYVEPNAGRQLKYANKTGWTAIEETGVNLKKNGRHRIKGNGMERNPVALGFGNQISTSTMSVLVCMTNIQKQQEMC